MNLVWVVVLSCTLQLAASLMALRLMRLTDRKLAWGFISAAVFLMAVRRATSLYIMLTTTPAKALDPSQEYIALTISTLMLIGIILIKPLFSASQRTEMAERELKGLMEKTVYDAPVPMMIHAEGGSVIHLNRAWTEISGYTIEEIPTVSKWLEQAYGKESDGMKDVVKGVYSLTDRADRGEFIITTKRGEKRTWDFSSAPLGVLPDGRKTVITTARDVTERKRFETECLTVNKQLESALNELIATLAKTVETRDPYTAIHQQHVRELAVALAAELDLSPDEKRIIDIAATIHDVGKIHIPTEILSRPAVLTDIEREIVKAHVKAGRDILKDIDYLKDVTIAVYQHHERLDGSGYPEGLKGKNIRMEAKVLAVADVFSAMSENRPYREAYAVSAALKEIKENSGKLYDAKVAAACEKLVTKAGFEFS